MRYFDRNTWFWIFISAVFFIPLIGKAHLFDWDEINFAELAREMIISGEYLQMQMNYERFTEKPPFFFWLQAISMMIFGVGEFAARFPNALLGVIVMPFLYVCGKFLVNRKFGFFWALSWFGSILPFLYFKSGIIDPWFNFFIFCALFFLIHYIWKKRNYRDVYLARTAPTYLWLAGIFCGLAILTKGPVAALIIGITVFVYWLAQKFLPFISFKALLQFALISLLVTLSWFGIDWLLNGPDFLIEFTIRQWELLTTGDAGHDGFPGYHFVVLLLGCFPASIFAIRAFGNLDHSEMHILDFKLWMIILLLVILILFSLVGTKIIHYSSLAYYPISFMAAMTLYYVSENKAKFSGLYIGLLIFIQLVIILACIALPYVGMNTADFMFLFDKDPFAMANLNAEVNWGFADYLPAAIAGLVLLLFLSQYFRNRRAAFKLLFFGNAFWVMSCLIFFINKVESISQGATVEFFEDKENDNVYVTTYNYKSYVPWFYAKVEPYQNPSATDQHWLLYGNIDKPVYISTKITSRNELENNIEDAEFLYEKNGFVFYRRSPDTQSD